MVMTLFVGGCVAVGDPLPPAPPGTRVATIEVVDAVISPGKFSHEVWDAFGTVPTDVWTGLATALGAPEPFTAVMGLLDTQTALLPKPDPFGAATLLSGFSADDGVDYPLATLDNNLQDTFTPTWPTPAHWDNVPLTPDLRVKVNLTDKDLSAHDPIGVVELNSQAIEAALAAGQPLHVKVSEQANAQILFVGILVQQTGVTQ